MNFIRFRVPGLPIAQPRPCAAKRGNFAHVYDDRKHPVNTFKAAMQMAAREAYKGPPLAGALSLYMEFVFPRPTAKVWKTRPMPRYHHTGKPDLDNLIKTVDSLNSLLWMDDRQIVVCTCQKVVAAGDEQPHVDVLISVVSPPGRPRVSGQGV